jgi:hypothetical protein
MNKLRQQFLEPADEFTPVPFWFWNDLLTKEEISITGESRRHNKAGLLPSFPN